MPFINTSGPNEAMIRTGYCIDDMTIKIGGLLYSLPWIHEVNRCKTAQTIKPSFNTKAAILVDLNMITVELKLKDLVTKLGVKLNIEAVSQLRIAKNEEMVKASHDVIQISALYRHYSISMVSFVRLCSWRRKSL